LLDWDTWVDFNIDLLDVVSSASLDLLRRFDWSNTSTDLRRSAIERFLGFIVVTETICRSCNASTEGASRILVGIL
jgi:hypothetical protein